MHIPIKEILDQYGYQGVFFAFLLEMVGIPFPGETILTFAGIEWKQGVFSLFPLLAAALAGNVIGSTIAYFIGRFLGRTMILRFGKMVRFTEKKFNSAEEKFIKYRVLVILFGKFIAGIRVFSAYLAGINRMNFWQYSILNLIGSFVWAFVFIMFGNYIHTIWQNYYQTVHSFLWITVGALLCSIILVWYIKGKLIKKENHSPIQKELSASNTAKKESYLTKL